MRKKSIKKSASNFSREANELLDFVNNCCKALTDKEISWVYEGAIIHLYREFEGLILDALIGAINNNSEHLSTTTGVNFPAHLKREVCEYLIVSSGYFDFKGRDGLIRVLKKFVPDDHYLVVVIKDPAYKDSLEKLSALRNYAAHGSHKSKAVALKAIDQKRMGSAGSWLKRQGRLNAIVGDLKRLACCLEADAPY